MTFAKKLLFLTLLTAAASLSAAAQEQVIKFKLAHATHLGSAVLPAGDYRMVLYSDAHIMTVVTAEGPRGASVIAVPTTYETGRSCGTASLTLTPNGNELDLTSVCFGGDQMSLYFSPSRIRKTEAATPTADTAALAGAQ